MLEFLSWWLIISLFGLAALPLTRRIFAWLPDRGYAFSKTAGLLLVSYLLWLGAITGVLINDTGGILFALLVVIGISALLALARGWESARTAARDFWRLQRREILTAELMFLLAFAGWTLVRAYAPDKILQVYGEKYMEIAFLNGILNSPSFPPLDPWLAGYSISYYYFGYVMMAVVTRLSGVPAVIGFDLYDALTFALTVLTAYGVVSNMVAASAMERHEAGAGDQTAGAEHHPVSAIGPSARWFGLLGALFVSGIGNLQGLLEGLYSAALLPAGFWQWLSLPDLPGNPQPGSFYPGHGWWWWRASRVLNDLDLNYQPVPYQPIDEFPFFSFLLGDNHPHKLALPFVLLAIGLALNLLIQRATVYAPNAVRLSTELSARRWIAWLAMSAWVRRAGLLRYGIYALAFGGLAFLNTWDFPIYLGLVLLVDLVGRAIAGKCLSSRLLLGTFVLAVGLGSGSILLYLFFYLGFSSQAGGVLPYVFPPTRLAQYLVMFGLFIFILMVFIPLAARQAAGAFPWRSAFRTWLWIAGISYGLYLLILAAGIVYLQISGENANPYVQAWLGDLNGLELLRAVLAARLANPWLFFLLSWLLALAAAATLQTAQAEKIQLPLPAVFALLLAFTGLALTLVVEFFYLRDNFGMRMNTIFKFYFQGWVLMACASAYGAWWVLRSTTSLVRAVFAFGLSLLVAAGIVYPVMGVLSRTEGFSQPPDLNAGTTVSGKYYNSWASIPDDWAAIEWMQENVHVGSDGPPVILEGVNGSYQFTGRVSAFTGFPTLLGWPGHEHQWRGDYSEPGRREAVIAAIYTTPSGEQALELLREWNVRYVILGDPERQYIERICQKPETPCNIARALEKFDRVLTPVFNQGSMTIFAVGAGKLP